MLNLYHTYLCQYTEREGRGRGMLSDADLGLLPFLFEEDIVNRFTGGIRYAPCCPSNPAYYAESCFNTRWVDTKPRSFLCVFSGPLSGARVMLSQFLTCFKSPLLQRNDGILTTHTMYYVSSGPSPDEPFFLTWVPIKSIKGISTSVKMQGAHPYQNCSCCGAERQAVIQKGSSRYDINIRTDEGFSIPFSFNIPYYNWLEDENYTKMIAVMGAADIRADANL